MPESSARASRRKFLTTSATGLLTTSALVSGEAAQLSTADSVGRIISSANGWDATRLAYEQIVAGVDPLDACVAGVNLVEADPEDTSVGLGGLPNEAGVVQLDAAVMHGPTHQAGAVAALEGIRYPSRVAQLVMEQTDHVLLVGEGALRRIFSRSGSRTSQVRC